MKSRWNDFLIMERENLERFLKCESVKNFYSKNGVVEDYKEFLDLINNISCARVFLRFYGDSNNLIYFKNSLNQHPENFDKIKEHNLEFEIERIMTSPDDNYFYDLARDGLHKSPVPKH